MAIARNDSFDDSDYSEWWAVFNNLNGAVSFGEGSPVAGAIGTSYTTNPSTANWGQVKIQSLFTMDKDNDITVRGTCRLTGGDAGSYGSSMWVGIRDPNNAYEYLVAMVRAAGGGIRLFSYAGPYADRNNVGNWTDWGGTSNQVCLLDAFYDQSASNIKLAWRAADLTWYTIDNASATLGADSRAVIYSDMYWNDYCRNDYPIQGICEHIYMSADSYSDLESPVFQSAAINVAGTQVTITFDEPLAGTADGITLTVGVLDNPLTNGTINGSSVTFDVQNIIGIGQTCVVSASSSGLTDVLSNALDDFTDESVTNNSTADIIPPTVSSLAVDASGTTLTIACNEAMAGTASGFTLTADAESVTVVSGTGSGNNFVLTINTIYVGQVVTLAYAGTTVTDTSANKLATFGTSGVTNNSGKKPKDGPISQVRWGTFGYRRR